MPLGAPWVSVIVRYSNASSQIHRDKVERWGVGEPVFHRDRVSVWGDEKVLEMMVTMVARQCECA